MYFLMLKFVLVTEPDVYKRQGDVVQLKMNVPFKAKNTPESLDELCKLIKHFLQKVSVEKDKICLLYTSRCV